jgi:hypothetical protein
MVLFATGREGAVRNTLFKRGREAAAFGYRMQKAAALACDGFWAYGTP